MKNTEKKIKSDNHLVKIVPNFKESAVELYFFTELKEQNLLA